MGVISNTFNAADQLRRLIAEDRVSVATVRSVTGISDAAILNFLETTPTGPPGLSSEPTVISQLEIARLTPFIAQLAEGFTIDDDERLQGIIETLILQFGMTYRNISLLTRTNSPEIESCVTAPDTVPVDVKYELAIRASYLLLAIANARATNEGEA